MTADHTDNTNNPNHCFDYSSELQEGKQFKLQHTKRSHKISYACYSIGFLVGVFVELANLGVNFVVIAMLEKNVLDTAILANIDSNKSINGAIIQFSFVWSIASISLPALVLLNLRSLIWAVFEHASFSQLLITNTLDELLIFIENRFIAGVLLGVSLAWMATDLLMGVPLATFNGLLILMVAVLWWKRPQLHVFITSQRCTPSNTNSATEDNSSSHHDQQMEDEENNMIGVRLV